MLYNCINLMCIINRWVGLERSSSIPPLIRRRERLRRSRRHPSNTTVRFKEEALKRRMLLHLLAIAGRRKSTRV